MKTTGLATSALSVALAAIACPSHAQTATGNASLLAPLVVTASRSAQRVESTLPDTQVITRADIEQSGATDIADVLRMLSAVDLSQAGGPGQQTSLFLRGGDSRHTLVLIDGVPLNKADFGAASIEHLPLDQVERIEVVRGNLSSLYGSQAVGGVVQIFTRQGSGASAALTAGSRATVDASVHLGAKFGDTRLALTLGHQKTDGVSAQNPATYPGADPDRDGYRNDSLNASLRHTFAPGHSVSAELLSVNALNAYDNAFATSPNPQAKHHLETLALASSNRFTDDWTSDLRVSALRERFSDLSNFTTDGRNSTTQWSWNNTVGIAPHQSLQLGLEAARSAFNDRPSSGFAPRDTRSLRLGTLGAAGAFDWQLDARSDHVSDIGSATTGYAGLGYKLTPQWKLIASLSNSFSAPTFVDLLYADPSKPTLKPERGESTELGVQFARPGLRARLTAFSNRIRDKVDFDPVSFFTTNIARSTNRGADLSVQADLPLGTLGLEASFNDPRNADTGQRLLRRSRENIALNYTVQQGRYGFGVYLKYVGERIDIDPATFARTPNPAYTRVDFTAAMTLSRQWTLRARLQNAFDDRHDEVLGYSATPRGVYLSVLYRD